MSCRKSPPPGRVPPAGRSSPPPPPPSGRTPSPGSPAPQADCDTVAHVPSPVEHVHPQPLAAANPAPPKLVLPDAVLGEINLVRPPARPSSSPPDWVILDCCGRKLFGAKCEEEHFVADLHAPPGISSVKAEHNISDHLLTKSRVLAADDSTALLVAAYFDRKDHVRGSRLLRLLWLDYRFWNDYNERPPNLLRRDVPDRVGAGSADERTGNIGLISLSGGPASDYLIGDLELVKGSKLGKLYLIRGHAAAEWSVKQVCSPVSDRAWGGHGVISYDGMLWWVDLSWGLLSCDPSVEEPVLPHELPHGSVLESNIKGIKMWRYVGLSEGMLRYLEISCDRKVVSLWTKDISFVDGWKHDYTTSFTEIWDDESYKKTRLPRELPMVALIHPTNPNLAYFLLFDVVFGIDLVAKHTFCVTHLPMESQVPDIDNLTYFLPWVLPRVVIKSTSDLIKEAKTILETAKAASPFLKMKLREIIDASRIIEESLEYLIDFVDGNIDRHLDGQQDSDLEAAYSLLRRSLRFSYSVISLRPREEPGSYNVEETSEVEGIINRLVASVAHDIHHFVEDPDKKIFTAIQSNHTEMVEVIRTHYFNENLEDIGFEAAKKILDSSTEIMQFNLLRTLNTRADCLLSIKLHTRLLFGILQEWDVQFKDLVMEQTAAADDPLLYEEDDIFIPSNLAQGTHTSCVPATSQNSVVSGPSSTKADAHGTEESSVSTKAT